MMMKTWKHDKLGRGGKPDPNQNKQAERKRNQHCQSDCPNQSKWKKSKLFHETKKLKNKKHSWKAKLCTDFMMRHTDN